MTTTSATVVGVFRERALADQAIEALYNAGFQQDQIRYAAPDSGSSGGFFSELRSLFTGTVTHDGGEVANDLTNMGLSTEDANYYANEYASGRTVLAVSAPDRQSEVAGILNQYGAYSAPVSTA